MEWIAALRGTVVSLDTAPIIYLIEENPRYLSLVRTFFQAAERGEFQLVTSTLTITEVLVHPLRRGDYRLSEQYRRILLESRAVTVLPVSASIAAMAADLRAQNGLRTPDAIQIATGLQIKASAFLTNDMQLSRIAALQVLVLDQLMLAAT